MSASVLKVKHFLLVSLAPIQCKYEMIVAYASLKICSWFSPNGYDHEIVGQGSWYGLERSYLLGPGSKEEGQLCHAEGASLWYAAGVVVGKAQASPARVL